MHRGIDLWRTADHRLLGIRIPLPLRKQCSAKRNA
jgi:hypothetical protein